MATTLDVESTLTDRYQTTVPETVRRALGLKKRDKIHYSIRPDGEVILTRAEATENYTYPSLGFTTTVQVVPAASKNPSGTSSM